jgi:signal transduction histidine kinase
LSPESVAVLGWVTAALAAALAAIACRRSARRMEVVARAAHELRGPITAATLGIRLGELTTARRSAIELELGRAGLALDDLAAVGCGGKPSLRTDPVDVRRLLADSVEAWRPAAAALGIELEFTWSGGPTVVLGERLRLAQATGNLIANAIEHGGGRVAVRARAEAAEVRIEFTDRGPGLPSSVAQLAASRSGRRKGSRGHGLAIAAEIVAGHGGRLAAAPSNQGARLVLTLPAGTSLPQRPTAKHV